MFLLDFLDAAMLQSLINGWMFVKIFVQNQPLWSEGMALLPENEIMLIFKGFSTFQRCFHYKISSLLLLFDISVWMHTWRVFVLKTKV